jgi:hypothetical protein
MHFVEIGSFQAVHRHLAWPWIAIDARRSRFAFPSSARGIATRALAGDGLTEGPSFSLPADLELPDAPPDPAGHRGAGSGVHGLSIHPEGAVLAVTGVSSGSSVLVSLDASGELRRSRLDALAGGDFTAHAVAFDRSGTRLWVSAESGEATALVLLDARSHAVLGVLESAAFPPPASHELFVHPQDDAVLLLAACGQDGTFARVAGWSDGPPVALPTALDGGAVPAGFVGFSTDGAHVHLVEADELRTHAWPSLEELSSVELADDFVSAYSGAVLGDRVLVDGHDAESGDDAVMLFDRPARRGARVKPPVPSGMWVGRLGADCIVTVASKGDPAQGRVLRIPAPPS